MEPDVNYEKTVDEICGGIDTPEQAMRLVAEEATRLGLSMDEILRPCKVEELVPAKTSPILDAVMQYFAQRQSERGRQ